MAADLIAIMDEAGLSSAHFLGHSTGGAIGVATALDYPGRLRSLMIYAQHDAWRSVPPSHLGLRRLIHAEPRRRGLRQIHLAAALSALLDQRQPRGAAGRRRSRPRVSSAIPHVQTSRLDAILAFDRRDELARITIPTMIALRRRRYPDAALFLRGLRRAHPGCANAHFAKRGGHALSRTEPDLFNTIAIDFFSGVSRHETFVSSAVLARRPRWPRPRTIRVRAGLADPRRCASSCRSRPAAAPTCRPA